MWADSTSGDGRLPHTCPLLAAAHSLSRFSPHQLSGPHCHQCLPLNGFGFGCHGDHHYEAVRMDSWAAGSAPGAAPGSPPPPRGTAAPRPGGRQHRPPVWTAVVPVGRGGGASLWKNDGRKLTVWKCSTLARCLGSIRQSRVLLRSSRTYQSMYINTGIHITHFLNPLINKAKGMTVTILRSEQIRNLR